MSKRTVLSPERAILLCVLLACVAGPACAQSHAPQGAQQPSQQGVQPSQQRPPAAAGAAPVSRTVSGLTLTSESEPRVRITFGGGLKYVGGHSFVLYDVANAEQHFFAEADEGGRVRRLYWVQFEGYLPGNDHRYNYGSKTVVRVGGLDFFADAQARRIPPPDPAVSTRPANKISDGDRARAFLASKGLRLASDEALWQRLVHMTDASNRNELMIIYLEDLGGTGLTAADLAEGGAARNRWESVSKELLRRALKGMTISRW